MAVYYVDFLAGDDNNSGLAPDMAIRDYKMLTPLPGDTVLFKRGTEYREPFLITSGADGMPITYGSYGEGDLPIFFGSVDVSRTDDWIPTDRENVWRLARDIPTDVGNFIFNTDECTATLRWEREALSGQGDFYDSRFSECNKNSGTPISPQEILMYSVGNPGEVYSHIEAAVYGERSLATLKSNVIVSDLCFMNSGLHALTGVGDTKNVTIRGCLFKNIGGCGWDRDRRIRFGNAVEFWIGAENILIENNVFKNIYDSCATHQGPDRETPPARNFHCRNNVFDTYSMAAFEYRGQMMVDSSFVGNVCRNAGCGFGMLGEGLPRRSEIWPQPMGHHIFIWRMFDATTDGSLLIADNVFEDSPVGAAIYSIIPSEIEAQITFENNTYSDNCLVVAHFGGKDHINKDWSK